MPCSQTAHFTGDFAADRAAAGNGWWRNVSLFFFFERRRRKGKSRKAPGSCGHGQPSQVCSPRIVAPRFFCVALQLCFYFGCFSDFNVFQLKNVQ